MNRLSTIFNVRPNERGLVALFVQYYFLLAVGFAFIQVVAFALFVATYGPQKLPFAYMSVAVMGSIVMLSYLWLSQRLSFARLLVLNLTFLAVANLLFWIALSMPKNGAAVFLLPAWFQSSVSLGNLAFWGLAGRVFDVRQGKRLFGLIGAGNWIAVVAGGFLVTPLIRLLGTYQLLLLASFSIGAAIIVQFKIVRRYFKPTPPPASSRASNKPSSLLKSRYIMFMFGLVIIWWLGFYFVDNIFYDRAAAQYPDAEKLANVIGKMVAAQGILALVVSFFLTSWIIGRFGLRGGLLVLPACLLAAIAGLSLIGTIDATVAAVFWLAALAKLVSVAFGFSLDLSARAILYQPLPENQRISAQTLADGIVLSLAIGLAGVFLLVFNTILKFSAVELSYLFLIIGAAWIGIVVMLAREYRLSLVKALKNRYLGGETAGNLADRACVDLFREQLQSPYPEAALYAINSLDEMAPEALSAELPTLLAHSSADIRREALRRMEQTGRSDLIPEIRRCLESDPAVAVRETALRTLAAVGGTAGVETVMGYLDDIQLPIRRGALIGLLSSGGLEGIMIAGQHLTTLGISTNPQDRMLAAQISGEIGMRNFYQPLVPLLSDSNPAVRREALIAAGKLNHRRLWPTIITALEDGEVHRAALVALIMGGKGSVPAIQSAFSNADTSPRAMIALARACAAIRGDDVIKLLQARMDFANTSVRTQILRALSACGYRADDPADVHSQLSHEAEWAGWLREARYAVGADPEVALLSDSLDYEFRQTQERLFYLLSFIYDPQTVLQVRYALAHGSATNSAYALEVLDMLLESDLKGLLFPLLDSSRQEQPNTAQVEMSRLSAMLQEPQLVQNTWVHTCILYALGQLRAAECSETITAALQDRSPLVRETAQWALSRLSPSALPVKGNGTMLSTIETVLILKTVGIFASIPDNVLAEIAGIVEEQEVKAGENIFKQGDLGDSMYIIISGKVRVHQDEDLLNYLGERDVFGEMALLDPEPRVASVMAVEDTRLFRLGQEPFYQLLDNYSEVARGIIRVLTRYLRARVHDVAELRDRIEQLEPSAQPER